MCKTKRESSLTPRLFSALLNGAFALATSGTKRSLGSTGSSRAVCIPADAELERPSGRKDYPDPPKKLFSMFLAEVGSVLGPPRSL